MLRTRSRARGGGLAWYKSTGYLLNNVLPTLIYDFDNSRYYDSASGPRSLPFGSIRTTNATMFDLLGRLVWAPANILTNSESTAGWSVTTTGTGVTPVITPNFGPTPDGTITGVRVQLDSGAAGNSAINIPCGAVTAAHTASIWMRSLGADVLVTMFVGNATTNVTATSAWQRFSVNGLNVSTTEMRVAKRDVWGTTGAADLLVWHPQIERTGVDSPKPYNATTGTAFYGARIDYDPATLAARGLLVESSRTNLVIVSENMADAAVTKVGVTISGSTLSPSQNTANRVQEDALLSEHYVSRESMTTVASSAVTGSVFAKADQRTRVVVNLRCTTGLDSAQATFDLTTGVISAVSVSGGVTSPVASVQNVGNGWWRCSLSAVTDPGTVTSLRIKLDNGAGTSYTGDGASGLYVWGMQLEQGATSTSYIPTTGTSATRADDNFSITTTGWLDSTKGTIYATVSRAAVTSGSSICNIGDTGGSSERNQLRLSNGPLGHIITSGGAVQSTTSTTVATVTAFSKVAYRYVAGAQNLCADGTLSATPGNCPLLPAIQNTFHIGRLAPGGEYLNGWIGEIRYYPDNSASNAQLQTLTT